jgi:hypothetical protein
VAIYYHVQLARNSYQLLQDGAFAPFVDLPLLFAQRLTEQLHLLDQLCEFLIDLLVLVDLGRQTLQSVSLLLLLLCQQALKSGRLLPPDTEQVGRSSLGDASALLLALLLTEEAFALLLSYLLQSRQFLVASALAFAHAGPELRYRLPQFCNLGNTGSKFGYALALQTLARSDFATALLQSRHNLI